MKKIFVEMKGAEGLNFTPTLDPQCVGGENVPILFKPGAALGLGLLGVGPPGSIKELFDCI